MGKSFRRLLILILGVSIMVVFLLAGCKSTAPVETTGTAEQVTTESTTAETAEPTRTETEVEKFKVAMVPPALVSSYFIECANKAKEAASKIENMEFEVLAPADETKVAEQVAILEDLVTKKVNLILLSSGNWEAVAPVLKEAIDAGIQVAIFNQLSDVPLLEGLGLLTAVGVDEVEGGKVAGKWAAQVLNGKGEIAILEGVAGDYWTVRTGSGVDISLSNYPDIVVVARQPANWERAKGMEVTENILEAQNELDLILAFNDFMALGAAEAVENAGRRDEIKISGYNGTVEACEAIKAGKIDMSVSKRPGYVGETLINEVAVKLMEGKKDEIPSIIRIEPVAITIENVDEWLQK